MAADQATGWEQDVVSLDQGLGDRVELGVVAVGSSSRGGRGVHEDLGRVCFEPEVGD